MAFAAGAPQAFGVPALEPPPTDSLLARFGLCAGDRVLGRFLVGDAGEARWYRGVLGYNTLDDARFAECVYSIAYEDGEMLFYGVELMRQKLESGWIRKDGGAKR